MATKNDLQAYVNELNQKYCKNTRNHLIVHKSYS